MLPDNWHMPNRLLREGICTSDPINDLSSEEEVFFYRLLVVADDFGNMDGRPAILKAQCFPLKDTATVARIETWVAGLVRKSMLARYEADGRPYLAVGKWETRVRTKPKYPPPPDDVWEQAARSLLTDCGQTADNVQQIAARAGARNARKGLGLGLGKGASDNEVVFDATSGHFSIPNLLTAQWAKAYPALVLDLELSKASAWLVANPKNAKSNYARFLVNWLQKAQDKAPRVASSQDRFAGAI